MWWACRPAGRATTGHRTGRMAVLQGATQAAVDGTGGAPPRTDGLSVAVEPHFAGGVTRKVLALSVGKQRAQMQVGDAILDVEVHHDGGALAVRAARGVGVPAGFDQAHERLALGGKRGAVLWGQAVVLVCAFVFGDRGVQMCLHGGVECRGIQRGQFEFPEVYCPSLWVWVSSGGSSGSGSGGRSGSGSAVLQGSGSGSGRGWGFMCASRLNNG